MRLSAISAAVIGLLAGSAFASSDHTAGPAASGHAPIGVMGDHIHKAGEWMVSYRYMSMNMEGNLAGSESISPDAIATTIPNRFFGMPMMPPTLRVVPTEMTMDMHMFGMMYAPTDKVTLMLMLNYLENEMTHITYQGGMGVNRLGEFTTESSGLGDTKVAALVGLYDTPEHKLHLNLGLSLPTGSIDEEAEVLTPMGMRPTLRMPYMMQLGSGTYDLLPGITYNGYSDDFSWGAQASLVIRTGEKDENYTLGDKQQLDGWLAYSVAQNFSVSLSTHYENQQNIDGRDARIMAPVQTANPTNYGGERVDMGLGANYVFPGGHRVALEYETVLNQNVNGVQMEMDDMLTLGYQYAF